MILKGEEAHQAAVFAHLADHYAIVPAYGNAGASALSAGFSSPQRADESKEAYQSRKQSQGAQIAKVKKMVDLGARKSWPDITVVSRSCIPFANFTGSPRQYIGLYIELKDEGRQIYLKTSGKLVKDERLHSQAEQLGQLNLNGAFACFASGSDQAIAIIDAYLTGQIRPGLKITPMRLDSGLVFHKVEIFADR